MKASLGIVLSVITAIILTGGLWTRVAGGEEASNRDIPPGSSLLYDQTANNSDDPDDALSAQDFESAYDAYDAQGADDFVVPWNAGWHVDRIAVLARYWHAPEVDYEFHVRIYENDGGTPGSAVCANYNVTATYDDGYHLVTLNEPCFLQPGTFWLDVQRRVDYNGGGQYGWSMETVQTGHMAMWQNPLDGFGRGCTTWTPLVDCGILNPDFSFQIFGVLGEQTVFLNGLESGDTSAWSSTIP